MEVPFLSEIFGHRVLSTDDDFNNGTKTNDLINTFYINVVIFIILIAIFEVNRHFKSIYFPRLQSRFKKKKRVPLEPSWYPFAWLVEVMKVSEEELLKMVGLDGYMMIRYLGICFRSSIFLSFFGLIVLVPVYANAGGTSQEWNKYTLANVPDKSTSLELWVPAVFAYIFAAYYCYLMHSEYKNFMEKRLRYLVEGDPDTPLQTYYTVMVEHLPSQLRSAELLYSFFESVFPGAVHSVELALDLGELDDLVASRKTTRNTLEKAIAIWEASGRTHRPTVWVSSTFYESMTEPLRPVQHNILASMFGYAVFDAIEHHSRVLSFMNTRVANLQRVNSEHARTKVEHEEVRGRIEVETMGLVGFVRDQIADKVKRGGVSSKPAPAPAAATGSKSAVTAAGGGGGGGGGGALGGEQSRSSTNSTVASSENPLLLASRAGGNRDADLSAPGSGSGSSAAGLAAADRASNGSAEEFSSESSKSYGKTASEKGDGRNIRRAVLDMGVKVVGSAAAAAETGVGSLAKEAKIATTSALKGMLEATRTLELLTVGAYYKTSTTAFVSLKTRVAKSSAHQMLLSHEHYTMLVKPAPNPKDIIWDNVSTPYRQVSSRSSIADAVLVVGALFWSIVVGFITTMSNLESISQKFTWLQEYQGTNVYKFLNNYLALGLLLILLACLPAIFDMIARSYEGLKQESEIQNVIMTRYFYYQLANVFVAVGLGSIASSLNQVINQPASILQILGTSLPQFSIYFTNLVIIKTFTAVPIELLRVWPLIEILSVKMCLDKKKCTRRELRTGIFADPPMLYGWVYPNIMMVLMIMLTYSTISPLLSPFAMLFFGLAYIMYKYQLLYVYINEDQSGGFMWYAVFNRSMVALIGGISTLLAYLLIRETFFSGPFYFLLPCPFFIIYFWYHCENKFKIPTMGLSLQSAIMLDNKAADAAAQGKGYPHESFSISLFKQPSLAEGRLKPAPYRKISSNHPSKHRHQHQHQDHTGVLEAGLLVNPLEDDYVTSDSICDPSRACNRDSDVFSDDENEDELEDDFDVDEVRESEVNEILNADLPRASEGATTNRISFSTLGWSTHLHTPKSHDGNSDILSETSSIEVPIMTYGSMANTGAMASPSPRPNHSPEEESEKQSQSDVEAVPYKEREEGEEKAAEKSAPPPSHAAKRVSSTVPTGVSVTRGSRGRPQVAEEKGKEEEGDEGEEGSGARASTASNYSDVITEW